MISLINLEIIKNQLIFTIYIEFFFITVYLHADGHIYNPFKYNMAKNLLIVESPAKAKTIEKILGEDFEVKSCYGHIRDLKKEEMGIDVNNNYKPTYIVPEEKEKVVKELKQFAKKSLSYFLLLANIKE